MLIINLKTENKQIQMNRAEFVDCLKRRKRRPRADQIVSYRRYRLHSSIREPCRAKRSKENRPFHQGRFHMKRKVPGAVAGGGGTQSIDT